MKPLRNFIFRLMTLVNIILLKLNKVSVSKHIKIDGLLFVFNKGTMTIGKNVRINSSRFKNVIGGDTRCSFIVREGAELRIGAHTSISNSAFHCSAGIIIDDHVMIGGGCKIWDSDFHPIDPQLRKEDPNNGYKAAPIHIKSSAFIGGASIILKGVTIGANAVIGAGSVVTKNIPDDEIWAGNPARFIKNAYNENKKVRFPGRWFFSPEPINREKPH